MNKPPPLCVAITALGLACALVIAWIWQHRNAATSRPVASTSATAPSEIALPPPSTGTAAPRLALDTILDALRRAMARGSARADEAVLAFKDDAALQAFIARAQKAGLSVVARADGLRTVRVHFDSVDALRDELRSHADDYASIGANNLVSIPRVPAKENRPDIEQIPFRNDTLAYLGATGDRSTWGRGVTIAILDSGVNADSTFGTGRLRTLDIGQGILPGTGSGDGHGTSVAALAAGMSPDAAGVAPAANVLSIRVTDASGVSDIFTVAQAIVAATDAGAKVINISLGGYSTSAALDAAIAYAQQQGAIIVAAAGNDQAAQLAWPAADSRVVSVGAIDRAEQQVSFSNSSPSLQLTAPGYGVQTAWLDNERAYVDGTSASAPLVAGALAAVLSQNPNLTPQQAAALLVSTASDGGAPGADAAYGKGILNVGWVMNSTNPNYVDTAVASHYYDAASDQVQFIVQNRSGRSVTGMSLNIAVGGTGSTQTVPSLSPGETYVASVSASKSSSSVTYTTQLTNPIGTVDQVPSNNRRTTVLSPPAK
ncbi:MAG: S8 family serine peptidase [Verrucomicrobiota bacterium]